MTSDTADLHAVVDLIEKDIAAEADFMLGDGWAALIQALHSGEGLVGEDDGLERNAEEGVLYLCAGDDFLSAREAKLLLTAYVDEDTWAADALLSDRMGEAFDGYLARLAAHLSSRFGQRPMAEEGSAQGPVIMTDRDRSLTWVLGERRLSLQRGMRCGDGDFHHDLWLGVSAA